MKGLTDDKRVYNYRHSRARRTSENLFDGHIIPGSWRQESSADGLAPLTVLQEGIMQPLMQRQSEKLLKIIFSMKVLLIGNGTFAEYYIWGPVSQSLISANLG